MKAFPQYFYNIVLVLFVIKVESLEIKTLYTFGDSMVDPGNNNYIHTITKSNFPPYGQDFVNHIPTGRFTNGLQVPDFIASYMGNKKYVNPYLDTKLSLEELMNAVSFASAGSGFDPLTSQLLNVIPMSKQLDYLRSCKRRLVLTIGMDKTQEIFENALFYVNAGSNDFGLNYFNPLTPLRSATFTVPDYAQFLLQHLRHFIQGLWEQGARRIAFAGLVPLGCIPLRITVSANDTANKFIERNCIESLNLVTRDFNNLIKDELRNLQASLDGSKIVYIDFYEPVMDIIENPKQYGFYQVNKGCCGTGLLETGPTCNPISVTCSDNSEYVFWDSAHLTEKSNSLIFEANRHVIDDIIH